jgi:UDP-N-acetylglucosamine 4,6-dehydratase
VTAEWPEVTIRVFSRDELKQSELRDRHGDENLRFVLGDVRDRNRLMRAAQGVDYIVHAAAMKQVPACEYNPFEAIQTNVVGAQNIVDAAIDSGVRRVIALSTDKAVNPVNLYGATKLCAEKIIVQGNAYAAQSETRLACVRYGNVVGSRGSVVPIFRRQAETGTLTITDERMTRFWITLDQSVDLVLFGLEHATGGEIFIPKIPSMRVTDLAEAMAPGAERRVIGIRPGEKLHEVLLTADEARHAIDAGEVYVVLPEHPWWEEHPRWMAGTPVPDEFAYSSATNDRWLTAGELQDLLP